MGVLRAVLLAGSRNRWLRERATRHAFVRRAVSRFMPGEELDDALTAAERLRSLPGGAILTRLGENVVDWAEADAVTRHYLDALGRIRGAGVHAEISVKLTQLGLDLDQERCHSNLIAIVERAHDLGNFVWIDMEQSSYVDATLELARRARGRRPNVGVCVQAYLHRTAADLAALIPTGLGVRLVKGAYSEPPDVAYPRKRDVDASYLTLAEALLADPARRTGVRAVFGTHDARLIGAIRARGDATGLPRDGYEFHLLYGIQRAEQERLAREGCRVRVLISYGPYWFPWYMRRLAERPANVLFVAKSLLRR